jgi:lipid II:glycine glycyltransferase (peptidoglycan interpeptide bridge formation enzyme)
MALEGSTIASFFIAARNTDTCYYIHGGSDMRFQSTRASDLLFSHAIQWAKSQGLQSFNFMSSPYKQKSLVFYKEKWGAETKTQYTYDVPINKVYASLFTIASTSNSLLKKVLNH